jgi:outer membrane receptor protein involved in Fe transport
MTLSGRYNLAKVRLAGNSFDENLDPQNYPLNGNHEYKRFNPAIGFNYNPSKSYGFYGGYNEGMRAPTPIELSCADPDRPCSLPAGFNSDPELKKVVAKTWEGGMRGKLTDDMSWNVGVYNTRTDNDIQFIASSSSGVQGYFQNVGQTERKGVEIGLHGKVNKLTFAANYGFVDATYETDFWVNAPTNTSAVSGGEHDGQIQVNKGNRIPGIARQTLKIRSTYEIVPEWNVGGNLLLAAGQYAHGDENNQDERGKVPGYAVLNLDTSYKLNANWILFAKVNNVFDKEYATYGQLGENIFTNNDEQFRTPAAPRAGWVGVTYQFGQSKQNSSFDKD